MILCDYREDGEVAVDEIGNLARRGPWAVNEIQKYKRTCSIVAPRVHRNRARYPALKHVKNSNKHS